MTHDRQPLGQNGRSEAGSPVAAVVELFCDCCDTPMAPPEVQWRLGPDDVTQVPFCRRCVQPGLLGAWRRLSLLQQLFVGGFLLIALVVAAVVVRQYRSPHRQIGVLMERARAQRLAGENRQAYETLAAALALEPNNAAACRELGFLYNDVLKRPAEAVAWLQRALAADPLDAAGRLALVRAALAIASEPLAAAALHDHFVTSQQFDALYLRAAMLAGAGQLAGAATLYEAMTVLSPDNPLGWVLLAEARDRLGQRFDEVLALYRQATRVSPDNPGGHYHLGRFLLAHGLYPAALESLRLAHRLAPESDLFLLALIDALELSGARAEALRCIEECRRARPSDATATARSRSRRRGPRARRRGRQSAAYSAIVSAHRKEDCHD